MKALLSPQTSCLSTLFIQLTQAGELHSHRITRETSEKWWCEKPFCRDLVSSENCKYVILVWSYRYPVSWLPISIGLRAVEMILPELETVYLLRETWQAFPAICPKHFTKVWLNGNLVLENFVEGNLKSSAWSGSSGVCQRHAKHPNKDFRGVKVYPSKESPKNSKFIAADFFHKSESCMVLQCSYHVKKHIVDDWCQVVNVFCRGQGWNATGKINNFGLFFQPN